jgi:hypothetical protein
MILTLEFEQFNDWKNCGKWLFDLVIDRPPV